MILGDLSNKLKIRKGKKEAEHMENNVFIPDGAGLKTLLR